ncbi:MAG: HEAT repeat domain-containing protein [Polyangiales bacterium]
MAGPRRKYPLPAGVIRAAPEGGTEDSGSRVRTKAPAAADKGSDSQPVLKETLVDLARRLVDELVTLGPHETAPVVRRLMALGNFALEELAESFPGPLRRHALATDSRLQRPDEISAIAAALAAFEGEAIPYLVRLMRHPTPKVRYYAAVICAAYSSPRLIEPLMQASLDEDRECRHVALHLLSAYQHEALYRSALGELRRCASEVNQPLPLRRRAISALTQLRDEASAALFVDLLADPDRGIATACRVGLRVLTAHDFGFSRDPWLRWLSERGNEIRVQWLIEGLGDGRANIRLLASRELWHLTRFLHPLSETADRDQFLTIQASYQRWWAKKHPE